MKAAGSLTDSWGPSSGATDCEMAREYDHLFKLLIIGDSGELSSLGRGLPVTLKPRLSLNVCTSISTVGVPIGRSLR